MSHPLSWRKAFHTINNLKFGSSFLRKAYLGSELKSKDTGAQTLYYICSERIKGEE